MTGVLLLAAAGSTLADAESDAARKDLVALAKDVEAGKLDRAKVEAIRKKYEDVDTIMTIYKTRLKGGLGFGPDGKADGIEGKLNRLGDAKAYPSSQLDKEARELLKVAYLNAAVAEVTTLYAPQRPKDGKGAAEWKDHSAAMKKASFEFIKAVKAGNPKEVQKAADNLNNSCNKCHTDFR